MSAPRDLATPKPLTPRDWAKLLELSLEPLGPGRISHGASKRFRHLGFAAFIKGSLVVEITRDGEAALKAWVDKTRAEAIDRRGATGKP